jgi:hypothetical protein
MPHRIQTFDSNGPNVKIRGNAYQVFERYVALAREAASSGDRIAAENLYQHAEHYFRVMNANGEGNPHGAPRPMTPADLETGGSETEGHETNEAFVQPALRPTSDEQPVADELPYSNDTPPFRQSFQPGQNRARGALPAGVERQPARTILLVEGLRDRLNRGAATGSSRRANHGTREIY